MKDDELLRDLSAYLLGELTAPDTFPLVAAGALERLIEERDTLRAIVEDLTRLDIESMKLDAIVLEALQWRAIRALSQARP